LATRLARGMVVHADRMRENIDLTYGALFSQRVLLALVAGGLQRDDAYRIAQRTAQQAWDTKTPLRELLERDEDPAVRALDLDAIFDFSHYTRHAGEIVGRLELLAEAPLVA
jgi:adenylosuccinate lyase